MEEITLNDYIKNLEIELEEIEQNIKWLVYNIQNNDDNTYYKEKMKNYSKNKANIEQLLIWLKELKELKSVN